MIKRKIYWINFFCLILFILDRILKKVVFKIELKRFFIFKFSLFLNKNIALGIFLPKAILYFSLTIIIFLITAMIIKSYQKENLINILGLEMILTGTISNLFDRIIFDAVVDYFFIFHLTFFNLADLIILAGVIILFWKIIILNQPFFVKKR